MMKSKCHAGGWLLLLFTAIAATAKPGSAADTPKRLNVLWIISEDMGPELGCYGTPEVWTPNLDALAANGMRFTNAFTTAPVCSASRSAFMTGMYQTTIGAHNHRSHRSDNYQLPEGVRLMSHRLMDAGYFTANIRDLTGKKSERFYRGTGKTDWNFNVSKKAYDSDKWADLKSHQPFYAQINFSETHRGAAWNNAHKHIDKTADPAKVKIPPYYPDHPVTRSDWAQYLNTVMALDKKVGFVLERLKEDGLAENTVVIFFGDHGRAMVRGKQWPYDSGLHVPLIVRWPQGHKVNRYVPGAVSDRLIEAIDLTATTLDIAGVEKPKTMQGRVLFGPHAELNRAYVFAARDRCDETVFRIRAVRSKRYRYIKNFMPERPFLQLNAYKERQYPVIHVLRKMNELGRLSPAQLTLVAPRRPPEELYDIFKDPYEINNLAMSPKHKQTLQAMRGQLERWIERTDDQGRTPESPEVLARWQKEQPGQKEAIEKRKREVLKQLEEN